MKLKFVGFGIILFLFFMYPVDAQFPTNFPTQIPSFATLSPTSFPTFVEAIANYSFKQGTKFRNSSSVLDCGDFASNTSVLTSTVSYSIGDVIVLEVDHTNIHCLIYQYVVTSSTHNGTDWLIGVKAATIEDLYDYSLVTGSAYLRELIPVNRRSLLAPDFVNDLTQIRRNPIIFDFDKTGGGVGSKYKIKFHLEWKSRVDMDIDFRNNILHKYFFQISGTLSGTFIVDYDIDAVITYEKEKIKSGDAILVLGLGGIKCSLRPLVKVHVNHAPPPGSHYKNTRIFMKGTFNNAFTMNFSRRVNGQILPEGKWNEPPGSIKWNVEVGNIPPDCSSPPIVPIHIEPDEKDFCPDVYSPPQIGFDFGADIDYGLQFRMDTKDYISTRNKLPEAPPCKCWKDNMQVYIKPVITNTDTTTTYLTKHGGCELCNLFRNHIDHTSQSTHGKVSTAGRMMPDDLCVDIDCDEAVFTRCWTPAPTNAPTNPPTNPPQMMSTVMLGDPEYRSLDGLSFEYNGPCSYILSTNKCGNSVSYPMYQIITHHAPSRSRRYGIYVAKMISFHIWPKKNEESYRIVLQSKNKVFINDIEVQLPYNGSFVQITLGDSHYHSSRYKYITVRTDFGLNLKWGCDASGILAMSIPKKFKTCGLLGNNNGDKTDDFQLENGTIIKQSKPLKKKEITVMGDSWMIPVPNQPLRCNMYPQHSLSSLHECKDLSAIKERCEKMLQTQFEILTGRGVAKCFASSHDFNSIDATRIFDDCVTELCSCDTKPGEDKKCSPTIAMKEFKDVCNQNGIQF